ncbi:MAG: 2-oxoacid:acceptor oxidoreductase subunit alpha [Chloroflexi bacterium]|nr:2-oxoacid:acceptor oxidoreductase subunit alpha [Chloroflexota bacterium]MCL5026154.1 2-oxoacid:acceptor oxidoreductase subunit alpha [Chloroflexota bacterium]
MRAKPRARLMLGNEACAEGAIAAGVRFFAGYPITPATETAEVMARRLPEVGGVYIQMEDELGSLSAVVGASAGGVKAMTATSSPGFSLMQEFISSAIIGEYPLVVANVMRLGPGIGNIVASQMDVMQARWGAHGGLPMIAFCPSSVRETFELTIRAVNWSERLRTPVLLMTDGVVGHMREKVVIPEPGEIELWNRPLPAVPPEEYQCFDPGPDNVPAIPPFGGKYRVHYNAAIHDFRGVTTMADPKWCEYGVRRLAAKIEAHIDELTETHSVLMDDAEIAVFAYGPVARAAEASVRQAREMGIKAGLMRTVTLWPFPEKQVREMAKQVEVIVVPEMNLGQMVLEVERCAAGQAQIESVTRVDSMLITPKQVLDRITAVAPRRQIPWPS